MKSIYINPEGIVCYLPDCPEEPEFKGDYFLHYGPQKGYEQALQAAKGSAVPFADQQQARQVVINAYLKRGDVPPFKYRGSLVIGLGECVCPLPLGWEVEVKEHLYMDNAFRSKKVAVLIPPPTSEQKPKGLYGKYIIQKANGKPIDPEAEFFVLRLDPLGEMNHVQACRKAVQVYANEIESFIPELAKDLRERYPIESEQKEESQLWREVYIDFKDGEGWINFSVRMKKQFTIQRKP